MNVTQPMIIVDIVSRIRNLVNNTSMTHQSWSNLTIQTSFQITGPK